MKQSSARVPARTIGIDLSSTCSTFVVIDGEAKLVGEGRFAMTPEAVDEVFEAFPQSRIVLEASTPAFWVARRLTRLGHEVIIANPRQLHLISKSVRKTDRNDAMTLARVGRLDPELLHPVWLKDERCLAVRAALRARTQLVRTRTRLISLVRAECKVHGVRLNACSSESFVKRARPALPEILREALEPTLDALDALAAQIKRYDAQVDLLCSNEFPETELLRQVSGVGPLVALSFVVAIGDPNRFRDSRDVGAYVGLAPRSYQSGNSDPDLRISKHGDRDLRTLLVSAAAYILRRSSPDTALKRCGRRLASRGNPRDKARARIAVARKLAVLLHRLWITAEEYEPLRATPVKA